jgi:uracil-DNA glycosylase family 4
VATDRNDGLVLRECYISAAARCAPPGNKPTRDELGNCRRYLEEELRLLRDVRVVVVLGKIGWEAWLRAAGWWAKLKPSQRPRFSHNAKTTLPDGMVLIASYHPSRQNTNTGRLTRDMWHQVFEAARTALGEAPEGPRG